MSGTMLLTGATGFLGTQLARRILHDTDLALWVLVRANDDESAQRRLERLWWDWPELVEALGGRVKVLCGDTAEPRLGLAVSAYQELVHRVSHIMHAAADLRLDAPLESLRRTNVEGVTRVLELARAAHRDHGLVRMSHVSTAYVAGRRVGEVPEEDLLDTWGFASAYEQTKFEGERVVQAARSELPISVYRPGMVCGDSQTGAIKTFNTLYYPLRLFLTGKLRIVPADARQKVNLVPVDYVTEAIVRLTFDPRAEGMTFHLTAPHAELPTLGDLVAYARTWARDHLGVQPARPTYLPLRLPLGGKHPTSTGGRRIGALTGLGALLPYLGARHQFRRDNVDRLLGPYPHDWRAILAPMLDFAAQRGFMHCSERTVHEQILFRLGRLNRPVSCYDIEDGRVIPRDSAQIRQDMLAAAGALRAMGIGPGDRVAIVGLNSTRYLTLDVAIGLVGAVSVPLYYTSPPAEIDSILDASGARLLFVGAPRLLGRLSELQSKLPVISFCREPQSDEAARAVVTWESFLARGKGQTVPLMAPVGFGDLATLRYTSGTTGSPKGVMFNHAHLRWMGECTSSLVPWHARNRRASWLSCLPMSHVVEGILATYAPYYLPASVQEFFLEDLRELPKALRLVRPTVFFSVPRVYEKVWASLAANLLGRRYLALGEGLARDLLRPVLKHSLLRKAGWDRCVQLIVGSAPAGPDLLQAYSGLGIEIYNAYGLTEAPLVTINRPGANRQGTVGTPLPETQVRIGADGEVLVRGPQVTSGYYGQVGASPLCDGWLHTGDLGRMTPEESLSLEGRKRDLFKTSYGKYVQPAKIEALLRQVSGVAEVVVVGEDRPYCVALLWLTNANRTPGCAERIACAIAEANTQLSHPEQVKRWAILDGDLSVEAGELTANLKVKRQAVTARLKPVLDALYGGLEPPQPALSFGEATRDSLT
ncbi:MAG: SDR family oxidoreductase [Anaerolineae bacterium]